MSELFSLPLDGIVDFCTMLPFFFLSGFIALRMMRVVRILYLFRINAYYDSFNVITSVLKEKKNQLISSLFIICVPIMAAGCDLYKRSGCPSNSSMLKGQSVISMTKNDE